MNFAAMPDFTFQRGERLKSRKVIEQLFKGGQSFAHYPLRIVWTIMDEPNGEFPAQFALSVSKKKFKRAVDRNRIRRLMREAYRLNKHILYERLETSRQSPVNSQQQLASAEATADKTSYQQLALMVIYTGSEILSFQEIEKAMRDMLRRFVKKYRAGNQK